MTDISKAPSHFKPGRTSKLNERHFVVHNYHDYALDGDDPAKAPIRRRKGGVTVPFPIRLHQILAQVDQDGLAHIFSWQPHGRCFLIHKPKEFIDLIMPKYFDQSKLTSFQRQLNLYGFVRLTRGVDATAYYHECFLRGKEFLAKRMLRTRIKGTRIKGASSPEQEPDFYTMPPVGMSAMVSGDDHSVASSSREMSCASLVSSSHPTDEVVVDQVESSAPVCEFVVDMDDPADALLMELQSQQPEDDPFYGLTHLKTDKGSHSNSSSSSRTVLQQVLAKDEAVRRVLQEILQDAQAEAVVSTAAV